MNGVGLSEVMNVALNEAKENSENDALEHLIRND